MKFSEAKSADDFGGMDALVKAAKKEGELNVIALPPDWANYGNMIKAFEEKYGIKVNSQLPDGASQDEINAANQQKGKSTAPDVFDLGQAVALANTAMFAPYKVGTFDEIPEQYKDPMVPGSTTTAATCRSATTPKRSPAVTSVDDLLKPEYKGKVALNGDPTQAGAAFSGVVMVSLAQGGSAGDIGPVSTSSRSSRRPATSSRSTRPRRPSSPGRPRSSSTGTTERGQTKKVPSWKTVVPRASRSPATTSRRSTRTARTRPPPGSGRSSSTATRARTCGSGAAPGRSALTPW